MQIIPIFTSDYDEIVQMLVDNGASTDLKDKKEKTPSDVASSRGKITRVQLNGFFCEFGSLKFIQAFVCEPVKNWAKNHDRTKIVVLGIFDPLHSILMKIFQFPFMDLPIFIFINWSQ